MCFLYQNVWILILFRLMYLHKCLSDEKSDLFLLTTLHEIVTWSEDVQLPQCHTASWIQNELKSTLSELLVMTCKNYSVIDFQNWGQIIVNVVSCNSKIYWDFQCINDIYIHTYINIYITVYDLSQLTLKLLETHGCIFNTVTTDALVLKHQTISIHNVDKIFIVIGVVLYQNISFIVSSISK